MTPTNLLGLTQDELSDFAEANGEPRYRGKQLFKWIYGKGVREFDTMSDIGKTCKRLLNDTATITGVRLIKHQQSGKDATSKLLFELPDGAHVESVLIPPTLAFKDKEATHEDEQRRLTLCVSTQVGCPLDCAFCATATMGFGRNLTTGEIVDQVLQAGRVSHKRITNIVFMGMGEPLMNYDNLMKAVEIIVSGIGIAARHITVSTAGWAERIRQLAGEKFRVKLAVSLHSADNDTRSTLMPVNKKFNLDDLIQAVEYYYTLTKQRVTYEYIFFDGINDSDTAVAQLVKLARKVPSKINVIPFHSIDFTSPTGFSARLRPSHRVRHIVEQLRAHNLSVFVRGSSGEDIAAACGQLAVQTNQTRRAFARQRTTTKTRRAAHTSSGSYHQGHSHATDSHWTTGSREGNPGKTAV